jgi:long-chain fatty acid transport protein
MELVMNNPSFPWKCLLLALGAVLVATGSAAGAGYALLEQSVKGLGTANAGGAAAADDAYASTIFFNPAGLARLTGSHSVGGAHVLFPSARFTNQGSTDLTGQPLSGGSGGNAGSPLAVPNLYYHRQLNDEVHLGLGVFPPFGLSTQYDATWVGRYHAVKSDLISININPALAWRVTDKLSLGAGVNVQYVEAELSNAIDFGAIFASLGVGGMAPQKNDGFVTFKGDSWSWGYNFGALYQRTENTRAGMAYRSHIAHSLRGEARFSGVPSPNPTGRFLDSGITSDTKVPDNLSVSLWHDLTSEIAVMADITWTNWSRFDELRIRFDNPAEADAVTTQRWRDAFRYAIGTVYTPGVWAFRAGVAYDESPVPDAAHRTPRIPDSDRLWMTGGVGYKISDNISLDLGYAHLFVKDATISKTATGEDRLRGALSGSYRSEVDIASVGIAWKFD